mgnify:CR=1 FL=1
MLYRAFAGGIRQFIDGRLSMAGNDRSKNITQGVARSPNRSMYYAMGYQKSDFDKLNVLGSAPSPANL